MKSIKRVMAEINLLFDAFNANKPKEREVLLIEIEKRITDLTNTRHETKMKSPDEIKKAISDYEFILDNQGYGSYEEKLEIEGKINLLAWVLGEEGK